MICMSKFMSKIIRYPLWKEIGREHNVIIYRGQSSTIFRQVDNTSRFRRCDIYKLWHILVYYTFKKYGSWKSYILDLWLNIYLKETALTYWYWFTTKSWRQRRVITFVWISIQWHLYIIYNNCSLQNAYAQSRTSTRTRRLCGVC